MLTFGALTFAIALAATMFATTLLAHRLGKRHRQLPSSGAGESAVFAMFGLLVTFSFSNAYSRFNDRRMMAATEANAIGTAFLRTDLLAEPQRSDVKQLMREYTDSRYQSYFLINDDRAFGAELDHAASLQRRIWAASIAGTTDTPSRTLVLSSMNDMFDVVTSRTTVIRAHPPTIVFGVLVLLALACAAMLGYAARGDDRVNRVYAVGFALVTGASLYLVFELEYPRYGLIRLDDAQTVLADTRRGMDVP